MINLYITSIGDKAGKTMVSAGLVKYWLENHKKVGYRVYSTVNAEMIGGSNADLLFMQKVLSPGELESKDQDIVITEGNLDALAGFVLAYPVGKVVVVHEFSDALPAAIASYQKIGTRLAGLVINKVPRKDLERCRSEFGVGLGLAKIALLGLIPEDRILLSMAVSDMAEAIKGKIVTNPENASDLIENLMLGSSTFDRAAIYYARKDNKAILVWGDRPGFRKAAIASLQLQALQTSTRCIVISGNAAPLPNAITKGDEQKVSIITSPGTLPEIVAAIEKAMPDLKFGQIKKLPRLQEILTASLNLDQLNKAIGL